jgi:hypothetical protein
VAALALTGCSTDLNPGTAATVDDTRISQSDVDDLVSATCSYSEALRLEQGAGTDATQSVANLRSYFTQQKVDFEITSDAVEELGLTVHDSTVTALAASNPMPEKLDSHDQELMEGYFEDQARSLLEQAVIGAHQQDSSVTVADDTLTQDDVDAAQDYLNEYRQQYDVEVNPAYGIWRNGTVVPASGSLSDPVSQLAKDAFKNLGGSSGSLSDLPPGQVCG